MVVLVQEAVGRPACVCEQGVEPLLLNLWITRHRARLADEGRHLIALDPCR